MRDYFRQSKDIRFCFPIDGDCVNIHDGIPTNRGLKIKVKVKAPEGHDVTVNGVKCIFSDSYYTTEVEVIGYRNTLVAQDNTSGKEDIIRVYKLVDPVKKYRISSDDNIIFLYDITKNKDTYTSIFDNPYLAVYKKAHDLYGAKVHLNLFYEFDDEARKYFKDERPYFNLSMMTDKFKWEFVKNSDWLKLAFHAKSEMPDKPYQHASAEKITQDAIAVNREIIRFAGRECISNATTIHWGEANVECARALRAMGYTALTGYFEINPDGSPLVSYYNPSQIVRYVGERDFWVDTEEDIIFGRIDNVTNIGSLEEVMQRLDVALNNPHRAGFISLMIHEQYFHSDYANYMADFEKRVLEPARILFNRGYTGALISDTVKEPNVIDLKANN